MVFFLSTANNTIQHASVQFILDTVIDELQKNPNRTFIYVEMAFFVRWWNEQSDDMKDIVSYSSRAVVISQFANNLLGASPMPQKTLNT